MLYTLNLYNVIFYYISRKLWEKYLKRRKKEKERRKGEGSSNLLKLKYSSSVKNIYANV